MKKYKKQILILLCIISYISINAQDSFIYLKKVDSRNFEIFNQNNEKKGDIKSSYYIRNIEISPAGNHISYIKVHPYIKPADLEVPNSFKILSSSGKDLHTLNENVRKYVWSNSGNHIAFITGKYYEGGIGYSPEKVIIYDVNNNTKEVVKEKIGAYEIAWSPDDSKLFIKIKYQSAVLEFNMSDKTLSSTEFKDIYFSPDGKYYYQKRNVMMYRKFAICDANSNAKIDNNLNINDYFDNWEPFDYVEIIGWAPGKKHVLLYKHIIEDVDYEDHVLPKKDPNDKNEEEWVLRDYKSRKVTKVIYKFYDVETDTIEKVLETNATEHKLITNKNILIYQEDSKGVFKEFKF